MEPFIYVSYPEKTVKFNICKNYGIDKKLQLGDMPLPIKIGIKEIELDYNFLLKLLPVELWMKIFDILHVAALDQYRNLVGCEMEYNIHRLFKKRNYETFYRDFQIKVRISPTIYQFYSTMYNGNNIREYYGYNCYICHEDLSIIEKLSDYVPKFSKCKCIKGGFHSEDCWGLCLTTDYDKDLVFTEGFNCQRILEKLSSHKRNGKIKTFKTLEYYSDLSKKLIDNFYSKKNKIRNMYKH